MKNNPLPAIEKVWDQAQPFGKHKRVSIADEDLLDWVLTFHIGDKPPAVSHFIAEPLPKHEKKEKEN